MEKITINRLERLNNSIYGNPRYLVTFTDSEGNRRTTKTKTNASCAYRLGSYSIDREYMATFTKSGTIETLREVLPLC